MARLGFYIRLSFKLWERGRFFVTSVSFRVVSVLPALTQVNWWLDNWGEDFGVLNHGGENIWIHEKLQ